MDPFILICRLGLAAVFAVAAVAKLTDRGGTRRAVIEFGLPEHVAVSAAIALPIAELVVAVLLLPASTGPAGALGALLLLLLFSAAILVNLVQGREPECHCFGQLHSAPANPGTLLRNGLLAVVAALTLAGTLAADDPSAVAWVGRLHGAEAAVVALGVVTVVLAIAGATAFVSLLRSYGHVLVRLERAERTLAAAGLTVEPSADAPVRGVEPGTPAPASGAIDELLAPRLPALLLFVSPGCGPCRALLPDVALWQREHADRLTVAVASDGEPEQVRAQAAELGLSRVLVDEDLELYRAFDANGTPSAVLIAPDGSIASRVATGPSSIEALVTSVVEAPGMPIGTPVPDLELPSLDGERVNLADLRGHETLLLFWNPDCGHCRAMHDQVLAREAGANGSSPRLVIVASGEEAKVRADGFSSTVLLDEDFGAGDEFGIGGTPMAVLLGADGRVASGVAAGARAVLAMAESRGNAEILTLPASL